MRGKRGFTLIEVLAAMAVAALILTATYGVVTTTVRAQKKTEKFLSTYKEGAAVISLLEEDLSAVMALPTADNDENEEQEEPVNFYMDTSGAGPGFSFISLAWDPVNGTRTAGEVGYSVERHDEMFWLYRRNAGIEDSMESGGMMTLITDRLISWEVSVYDGKEWMEEWEDTEKIPEAVKIEFELEGSDGSEILFSRQMTIPAAVMAGTYKAGSENEETQQEGSETLNGDET